ncbi:MAG: VOC family protein [Chloroflexi bacterium]|nr:VOC family protein [Chloroflexota bacterium]
MFTRIDHIMICVRDLDAALKTYRETLGFHVYPGGDHPGRGTHNAIGFFDLEYLELLGVRDRAELERDPNSGLLDFLAKGEGLRFFILASDDLDADVAAMRARGIEVRDVREGSRQTPGGVTLRWRFANLGPANPLPFFLIQHLTPDALRQAQDSAQRQAQVPQRARHPNGALGIDRVAVAVVDLEEEAAQYGRALGLAPSPVREEPLLAAKVVSFPIGQMALVLAEQGPGPGPAREALERRGPGPFLVAFRTASLADTQRWMLGHHVNIGPLGARADGRRAMLTRPEPAHGLWMGWVE